MAINVNTVYQTVLLILNKEQRGYMTPDEFNKIGTQVQLEIFQSYFDELNQQLRVPDNDSEYADRIKNINEDIQIFKTIGSATSIAVGSNTFNLPTSGEVAAVQNFTVANPSTLLSFPFTTITSSQLASSVISVTINGVLTTAYSINGINLQLNALPAASAAIVVTAAPEDFYMLGSVIYQGTQEAELIERNELLYVNSSPLTKPTNAFPLYLYENDQITLYPTTITSNVTVSYLRKPKDVRWNFTVPSGQTYYQYNATNSVDFELSKTEQSNVILKVLLYAGVVVKDQLIIQVAAQQIAQEQQNSKM